MTQKEMDLKIQQLNFEHLLNGFDIKRRKEEVERRKRGFLQKETENANAMKAKIIEKTRELRKQFCECSDDVQRNNLKQEIFQLERELSVSKSLHQDVINRINTEALDARMKLDDEARELEIRIEREKLKISEQYIQEFKKKEEANKD